MPHTPSPLRSALKGAFVYALFGFLWILLSDKMLVLVVGDQDTINRLQTYKGWFYVFITALLVYGLIHHYLGKFAESQRALRVSENRYRHLVDNAGDAFFLLSSEGKILDVNAVAVENLGYSREELLGMDIFDIAMDFTREDMREKNTMPLLTPNTILDRQRRKDGSVFPVEVISCRFEEEGNVLNLSLVRDITQRMKTQEMLVQSEKMRTIGGLAAGMAHEINNPLSVIMQGAQAIQRRLSPGNDTFREASQRHGIDSAAVEPWLDSLSIPKYLDGMQEAAKRASGIIRTMLDFSHSGELTIKPYALSAVVVEALELAASDYDLSRKYGFGGIEIRTDHDPALGPTPCNRAEMVQVVLNLLSNAAHALHAAGTAHPVIELRTRLEEGNAVLEVSDNGPGVSEAIASRIFEPFFTTKDPGVGTGLGLSVSFYIVTQDHGGRLLLDQRSGPGATFRVELPL